MLRKKPIRHSNKETVIQIKLNQIKFVNAKWPVGQQPNNANIADSVETLKHFYKPTKLNTLSVQKYKQKYNQTLQCEHGKKKI